MRERRDRKKICEEIIVEKSLDLEETWSPQIQAAQWSPSRKNRKDITSRHIIISSVKSSDKEKNIRPERK